MAQDVVALLVDEAQLPHEAGRIYATSDTFESTPVLVSVDFANTTGCQSLAARIII